MAHLNPFRPNSPVGPEMFIGRQSQVDALEEALLQTRSSLPKSFTLTGERGIGKTSLLLYCKAVAQGNIDINGEKMNFLVIELDLDASSTKSGLIQRVGMALERELTKTDVARTFISNAWKVLKQLEVGGVSIRDRDDPNNDEILQEKFAYSLATTTNRITKPDAPSIFGAKYDGIILLIDEADNAPKELGLGSLLKLLCERIQRHGCERFMIGLAGMPNLREVLRESHPSSLRIFDELQLDILSDDEVSLVIDRALDLANEKNDEKTIIEDTAKKELITLSEGYPHFIQQFGSSAFSADTDRVIDFEDVRKGAYGPGGALEKIGDRYYRDDFYNKIQKETYRQVLRIMAEHQDDWVSKQEIRSDWPGKQSILDNALHTLKQRKIILTKVGERGMYRLQYRAFAVWIKKYAHTHGQ